MGLLERGGILRNDKSWTGRAKAADIQRKCPRPPASEPMVSAAKPKKKAKKEPEKKTWPNAGKYTPKKERGR